MATTAELTNHKSLEDPLAYLPCSNITEYQKGQLIYSQDQAIASLCLVISGKVKVSRVADDGQYVALDIYQAGEFFGESAFLGRAHSSEQVMAMENTQVMTWTISAVENLVIQRPRLGIALLQILVDRTTEFQTRVESFAIDNVEHRLARTLIRLGERFGLTEGDGTVRMMPFSHELLAQFVGTSRELVTKYMIDFRNRGGLEYSRKGISFNREALQECLRQNP